MRVTVSNPIMSGLELEDEQKDDGLVGLQALDIDPKNNNISLVHLNPPRSTATKLIGSPDIRETVSCPCCNQRIDKLQSSSTLNEPAAGSYPRRRIQSAFCPEEARKRGSLLHENDTEESDDENEEDDRDVLPGVLAEGVNYVPTRVLAEGWLHKKGTGNDWLYSRGWKARWTRLCFARVDGHDIDVPLLLIYWFPSSDGPSTVILLDHTVVLKVDHEDKTRWNSFRFEVRHVPKDGKETPVTRTFAAPQKGRDAWVYAISDALLSYEKDKHQARKMAAVISELSPIRSSFHHEQAHNMNHTAQDLWMGDRFVSPPSSPMSIRKVPSSSCPSPRLPRPERKNATDNDIDTIDAI